MSKRQAISAYQQPIAKRLRRVERIQQLRRPETKYAVFQHTGTVANAAAAAIELTAIAQGNGADEREGNHVKILRVQVRGVADTPLDMYIIQGHTTTVPAYSDFNAVAGGALSAVNNNTKFTEWKHFNGFNMQSSTTSINLRFPYGLKAKFNGSATTNCVDNRLFLFLKNNSGGDMSAELTVRVWYLDQ